jgi:hypothetical protein
MVSGNSLLDDCVGRQQWFRPVPEWLRRTQQARDRPSAGASKWIKNRADVLLCKVPRLATISWSERMRIVLAVIVFAFLGAPAFADEVRILSSRGGEVGHFIELFDDLRKSGDRVVIDGPCLSACTLERDEFRFGRIRRWRSNWRIRPVRRFRGSER